MNAIVNGLKRKSLSKQTKAEMDKNDSDQPGKSRNYFFNLKLLKLSESKDSQIYFYFDSITSAIENRELRKGIDDKNMLLATVTHDLRAPLGSITMTLKQIEEEFQGNLSATLREMMRSSLSSCDLLNFLINDILDASKLFESGELKLNLEPCKLDDVFGQVFKIMESKFLQKEVRFETFVTDDVPETLMTDSRRLI